MSATFNPESIPSLRDQRGGMTQNQLASMLGCTPDSVRNWENGRSTPAGFYVDSMHRMCHNNDLQPPLFYQPPNQPPGIRGPWG